MFEFVIYMLIFIGLLTLMIGVAYPIHRYFRKRNEKVVESMPMQTDYKESGPPFEPVLEPSPYRGKLIAVILLSYVAWAKMKSQEGSWEAEEVYKEMIPNTKNPIADIILGKLLSGLVLIDKNRREAQLEMYTKFPARYRGLALYDPMQTIEREDVVMAVEKLKEWEYLMILTELESLDIPRLLHTNSSLISSRLD